MTKYERYGNQTFGDVNIAFTSLKKFLKKSAKLPHRFEKCSFLGIVFLF